MIRIGVDVGGTNTDAVLMDGDRILAAAKSPTSEDVVEGVVASVNETLAGAALDRGALEAVMIGTTHFTNAVIERRHLARTACVRLCLPATACLPPMVDWPEDLKSRLGNRWWLAHGGHEFDGREISPLDERELGRVGEAIAAEGIEAIALASVFSPVTDRMERRAREVLAARVPRARFTLSAEIGRLGLLERESAAIMNASLGALAERTVAGFAEALARIGLDCPWYITQNDGTLMDADFVRAYPVLTFASGPTNSMRGASFLSGIADGIVVDVGGTSTDVGALVRGFPRAASTAVDVGGVRTNFRMPDVRSIALGGGTIIGDAPGDAPAIGPESVGYRIGTEARVFGGATLTATDVAVGLGRAEIGDRAALGEVDARAFGEIERRMHAMIEDSAERMRVSPDAVPVIAVGGGSLLVPDALGPLAVTRPEHFAVANAVGAAIGQVSGEVDRIFSLASTTRAEALGAARAEATARAVAAGARPGTVEVIDQEDVPLAYLPGNATRVRVKVVGDLGGRS